METKNPIIQLQEKIQQSNCSVEELQCLFHKTSKDIMNNYILQIDNLEIELKELEFYFFDCEKHPDIYVHQNEIQKNTSNFLYVHDSWDNRGGIDLTFGNGKYYGGILIRGIEIDGKYISGPARLRNYIVSKLSKDKTINSYKELQKYFDYIKNNISLIKKDSPSKIEILHSTRVGLKEEKIPKYSQSLYRFIDIEYINASPKLFNDSKKNVGEITKAKAISFLSGLFHKKTFETSKSNKDEIEKIEKNELLKEKYIKKFREICKNEPKIS